MSVDPTQLGALTSAVAFAAAAFYVSAVEHGARRALAPPAELVYWQAMFKKAAALNGSLAIISCALAWKAYQATGDPGWKVASVLIGSVWPWTVLFMTPVNRALLAHTGAGTAGTRAHLTHWIHLHHARTAVSLLAVGTMFSTMAFT